MFLNSPGSIWISSSFQPYCLCIFHRYRLHACNPGRVSPACLSSSNFISLTTKLIKWLAVWTRCSSLICDQRRVCKRADYMLYNYSSSYPMFILLWMSKYLSRATEQNEFNLKKIMPTSLLLQNLIFIGATFLVLTTSMWSVHQQQKLRMIRKSKWYSHCGHIVQWLCVWVGCTTVFCHLLHIFSFRVSWQLICTLHYLIIIFMQTYLDALNFENACQKYAVDCVSMIESIISIIFYSIYEDVIIANMCILSYYIFTIKSEAWITNHC